MSFCNECGYPIEICNKIGSLQKQLTEARAELNRYKTALEKAREALAEVCNTRCYEMAMTKQALAEIKTVLKEG